MGDEMNTLENQLDECFLVLHEDWMDALTQ